MDREVREGGDPTDDCSGPYLYIDEAQELLHEALGDNVRHPLPAEGIEPVVEKRHHLGPRPQGGDAVDGREPKPFGGGPVGQLRPLPLRGEAQQRDSGEPGGGGGTGR
jgi:hypothetical protein